MMQSYDPATLIKLRPRPATIHISQNQTIFEAAADGFIPPEGAYGLYVQQGRALSRQGWLVDGQKPQPVALSNVWQHSWLGYYVLMPPGQEAGPRDLGSGMMEEVSEKTLEFRLSRFVGDGMHEDVDLGNFSRQPTSFQLQLELDADFAGRQELHVGGQRRGTLGREWRNDEGVWELLFDYRAEHTYDRQGNRGQACIHRGLAVRITHADSAPQYNEGCITFQVSLPPQGRWHACLDYVPIIESRRLESQYGCRSFVGRHTRMDELRETFLDESTGFAIGQKRTLSHQVMTILERSRQDLISMRLYNLDHSPRAWTMAAGLPIYIALFGRDTLTAGWQAGLLGPEMMTGTLQELARWQGTEDNPWRDEQPGKMLHEAHTEPLAKLRFNPRDRYYGAITTSAFYPVVVSELWHWTGDKDLIRPLLDPSLRCFEWLERYGDLNGDGFVDYKSRSEQGNRHQAWKDSDDAIVYEDGAQAMPPIATCEEQGFVYAAKLQFAEVLWALDRKDQARRLFREARELKKRFNDAFWVESIGTFAVGLDSEGRQIGSVTSNPGHCIASGITDKSLVKGVADRLFHPDMFSGWGIRTLSSENPAYNPYSYHRGSIWPVEHGAFAVGFMRYGLWEHLHTMSKAMFEAAALFDHGRLPEVFSGHARDEAHPFPALYPKANWPQAWSASANFSIMQAMLGLYPYAPLNLLILDPHLPDWLPRLALVNLRVGNAAVTLEFTRAADGSTDYRVVEKSGKLRVVRQPSPWSLTAGLGERLHDVLATLSR